MRLSEKDLLEIEEALKFVDMLSIAEYKCKILEAKDKKLITEEEYKKIEGLIHSELKDRGCINKTKIKSVGNNYKSM